MSTLIAICGLDCGACPAYQATLNDDDAARATVAALCSTEEYTLSPKDIHCDGCPGTEGRLLSFCYDCDIRACGVERGYVNCAHCPDFGCEKLQRQWEAMPGTGPKETLERIRAELT